jgi:hypothetical protein
MDPSPVGFFAQTPYIYDCFAIVNHYGSIESGHYSAYVNHDVARLGADDTVGPGKWCVANRLLLPALTGCMCRFDFDDSRLAPAHRNVVTPAAYMLLYRRHGMQS